MISARVSAIAPTTSSAVSKSPSDPAPQIIVTCPANSNLYGLPCRSRLSLSCPTLATPNRSRCEPMRARTTWLRSFPASSTLGLSGAENQCASCVAITVAVFMCRCNISRGTVSAGAIQPISTIGATIVKLLDTICLNADHRGAASDHTRKYRIEVGGACHCRRHAIIAAALRSTHVNNHVIRIAGPELCSKHEAAGLAG